ncbi:diguanylate cyclase domain-containing protein [Antarctobacter jejuensis]|uniref:diguanylate cyclase domain-containing protein n=1 Tax=Antarctobacter jejuensis TaxID=1439938 RepID=UPI003FD56322
MRYIYTLLLCLGALSVTALVAMLFWLTHRIDVQAREHMREAHQLILEERLAMLSLAVRDYAHWTLAHDLMTAGDEAGLYDNIGSAAAESDLFDWIFLLSPDGTLLHAYGSPDAADPATQFDAARMAPFLADLRDSPPEAYGAVSGFAPWDGVAALVAVARITPENLPAAAEQEYPIMVGVTEAETLLMRLEQLTGASRPDLTPFEDADGRDGLWLMGPDGQVAQLSWDRPAPGTGLRQEGLPVVVATGFAMLAICFAAGRFFGRQARRLNVATVRASTDPLTGLLNRAGLEETLQTSSLQAALEEGRVGVLNLDLNDFKALNDTHGHKSGDMALQVTADRLRSAVRDGDFVARLGGDEFICLIVDRHPDRAARKVAERIADLCGQTIRFEEHASVLRPSIGVAIGGMGEDWETLLAHSDAAMYWAKKRALNAPAFHGNLN